MNPDIAAKLLDYGLIQFGRFFDQGAVRPFQLTLDMVASYPDLLDQVARHWLPVVQADAVILSAADAVPLGTALSLLSGRPLVYSKGSGTSPVTDLVGAYDVGHRTVLVTLIHGGTDSHNARLAAAAHRVGLEVERVLSLLDLGGRSLPVTSAVEFPTLLSEIERRRMLPAGQIEQLKAWLNGASILGG